MIAQQIPCEYGRTELVFPDADENEMLWEKRIFDYDFYRFEEGVQMAYVIHLDKGGGIRLKELEVGVELVQANNIIEFAQEDPVGKQPEWDGGIAVFILRYDAKGNTRIELKPLHLYRLTLAKLIQTFARDLINNCRRNIQTKDCAPLLRAILEPPIITERNGVEIEIGVQNLDEVPFEISTDGVEEGIRNVYALSGEHADELLKSAQIIKDGKIVDSIFAPTIGEQLIFGFSKEYIIPSTVCYFYHGGKKIRIGLILDDISKYAEARIQKAAEEMVEEIESS